MKTVTLGRSSLVTTRLAYGCWRLAGTWDAALVGPDRRAHGQAAVLAAFEAGYTLFDLADIYCDGVAESIFGEALKAAPDVRGRIVIASKCGIRKPGVPHGNAPYRYDFSASYIIESCEGSLRRLGVETIDLFQLHRPDFLCDPEEVAGAFASLKAAGKVREFGVSNFRPSQVTMLQKACPMPLLVNQVEISLAHVSPLQDGTLDQCLTESITPLAWSPLGGGKLLSQTVDMTDPHHAQRQKLHDILDLLARERGTTRSAIALAWLLRHPARVVPIVGSTDPERIRESVKADAIELTREEWYRLLEAALGQRLP